MKTSLHHRPVTNRSFCIHALRVIVILVLILSLTPLTKPAIANSTRATDSLLESSGTSASEPQPVLLKDIYTANATSNPYSFFPIDDKFYFFASDSTGQKPWVSDGTEQGTQKLIDVTSVTNNTQAKNFVEFQSKIFFSLFQSSPTDYYHGLWMTDGTKSGTKEVIKLTDQNNQLNFTAIERLIPLGDWLYIATNNGQLLRYGGTENTLEYQQYTEIHIEGASLTMWNGNLYFLNNDNSSTKQLWRVDGSTGQTSPVKTICSDNCQSPEVQIHQHGLVGTGNLLFFTEFSANEGSELWATDGTEAGTYMVKDLNPGPNNSSPYSLTAAGNWLYFSANNNSYGNELWRTDGTTANTTLITDLNPGEASAAPKNLTYLTTATQNYLFFTARDAPVDQGHGIELWYVPVTAQVAQPQLLEIAPGPAGSFPSNLIQMGEAIYFAAQDTPGDIELWKATGTGVIRVADLVPGADGSMPILWTVWQDKLVLSATDAVHGHELWVSDGTPGGQTFLLKDLRTEPDKNGSMNQYYTLEGKGKITHVGGRNIRYFTARDALHGEELWRSDGTEAGTWMVKDIYPGPIGARSFYYQMVEMGGILYFEAEDLEHGPRIWRTDGTTAGTWPVKGNNGWGRTIILKKVIATNDRFFFVASDESETFRIWVSDGTTAGTHPLPNYTASAQSMATIGNMLVFCKWDAEAHTVQLWRTDGSDNGTQPFFGPITSSNNPQLNIRDRGISWMMSVGKYVYFNLTTPTGPNGTDVDRLWITDGTAQGTKPIYASDNYEVPGFPFLLNNTVYFIARLVPNQYITQVAFFKVPLGSSTPQKFATLLDAYGGSLTSLDGTNLLALMSKRSPYGSYYQEWDFVDLKTNEIHMVTSVARVNDSAKWHGKMYFAAPANNNPVSEEYIYYVIDGSTANPLINPLSGQAFVGAGSFISDYETIYFTADDGVHGEEPWVLHTDYQEINLPLITR